MRSLRTLLLGVASVLAFFAFSSSAMAALSILPVTTRATASGATSLIESTGTTTQITCGSSSITDAIAADGSSVISTGGALFSSCTLGIAVTQTANWTNQITALLTGGQITGIGIVFTVPTDGVHLKAALGCEFYLGGTQSALIPTTATTPPALVTVNGISAAQFGSTLGLRVTRVVTNTLCPAVALGDLSRFAANYSLSPAVSGTLL